VIYMALMPQQRRRIVFFLGAGASLGAGAVTTVQHGGKIKIPTQETFWDTFLRFCSPGNRTIIEPFLFRYFLGYARVPSRSAPAARRMMLKSIDVEEVFTFLSERNHAPRTSIQFQAYTRKVWEALISEIGHVFARFSPNINTRRTFRTLRNNHIRHWDTVISFNYDIVFEYSLPYNFIWHYAGAYSAGGGAPVRLRILKPHGSINWEEIDGEINVKEGTKNFPRRPIIVAPTHLKFIGTGEKNEDGSLVQRIVGYTRVQQLAE
jgi:hypothetical protein